MLEIWASALMRKPRNLNDFWKEEGEKSDFRNQRIWRNLFIVFFLSCVVPERINAYYVEGYVTMPTLTLCAWGTCHVHEIKYS